MSKFNKFITSIKNDYQTEPKADVAIRVLECLTYIQKNLNDIERKIDSAKNHYSNEVDKQKGVFRAPNGMSFHVKSYKNGKKAKNDLNTICEDMKSAIAFIENQDPIIIKAFINSFDDSDVGCMEARVADPLKFVAKLKSQDQCIIPFHALMKQFYQELSEDKKSNDKETFLAALSYFNACIGMPVVDGEGNKKLLSWQMVKDHLANILEYDIEQWPHLYQSLFSNKIFIIQDHNWFIAHTKSLEDAQIGLHYIKSIIGLKSKSIGRAKISYSKENQGFCFKLTRQQYTDLQNVCSQQLKPSRNENIIAMPDDKTKQEAKSINQHSEYQNFVSKTSDIKLGKSKWKMIQHHFKLEKDAKEFVTWLHRQPQLKGTNINKCQVKEESIENEKRFIVRLTNRQYQILAGNEQHRQLIQSQQPKFLTTHRNNRQNSNTIVQALVKAMKDIDVALFQDLVAMAVSIKAKNIFNKAIAVRNKQGATVFHFAAVHLDFTNFQALVALTDKNRLIAALCHYDSYYRSALDMAAYHQNMDAFTALLERVGPEAIIKAAEKTSHFSSEEIDKWRLFQLYGNNFVKQFAIYFTEKLQLEKLSQEHFKINGTALSNNATVIS